MKIVTGGVYDHERYGRVLVTGIGEMYQMWDTENSAGRASGDVVVYFQKGLEDYRGASATLTDQRVAEFEKESKFVRRYSGEE